MQFLHWVCSSYLHASSAHLHADHAPAGSVREVDVVEVAQEGLRVGRRQVLQQPAGGSAKEIGFWAWANLSVLPVGTVHSGRGADAPGIAADISLSPWFLVANGSFGFAGPFTSSAVIGALGWPAPGI